MRNSAIFVVEGIWKLPKSFDRRAQNMKLRGPAQINDFAVYSPSAQSSVSKGAARHQTHAEKHGKKLILTHGVADLVGDGIF
jgi:hypothetical protein